MRWIRIVLRTNALLLLLGGSSAFAALPPEAPKPIAELECGGVVDHYALTSGGKVLALSLDHGKRIRLLDLEKRQWAGDLPESETARFLTTNSEAVFSLEPESGTIRRYDAFSRQLQTSVEWAGNGGKASAIAGIPSSHADPLYVITDRSHLVPLDPRKLTPGDPIIPRNNRSVNRPANMKALVAWDGTSIVPVGPRRVDGFEYYRILGKSVEFYTSRITQPALGHYMVAANTAGRRWDQQLQDNWIFTPKRSSRNTLLSAALDGNLTVRATSEFHRDVEPPQSVMNSWLGPLDQAEPQMPYGMFPEFPGGRADHTSLSPAAQLIPVTRQNLLITVDAGNKLRLRPLHADDQVPLHFNSLPPLVADRNSNWEYRLDVRGGTPPYKFALAGSPPSMSTAGDTIKWQLPPQWVPSRVEFRVEATDAAGASVTQKVRLHIGGSSPARVMAWHSVEVHKQSLKSLPEAELQIEKLEQVGPFVEGLLSRKSELPGQVRETLLSNDGKVLALLLQDQRTISLLDVSTASLRPGSLRLPEPVGGMVAVNDLLGLYLPKSNQLELRPFATPEKKSRWLVPKDQKLHAIGLASEQPAAPLVALCDAPGLEKPVPRRTIIHFLDAKTMKPTRWKLYHRTEIPYHNPREHLGPSGLPALQPLEVTPDGRKVTTPVAFLHFKRGFNVELEARPKPKQPVPARDPYRERHLPFGLNVREVVGSADGMVFVSGGMRTRDGKQVQLTVLDEETRAPLFLIRGIGDPPKTSGSSAARPRFVHYSQGSAKLFVLPANSTSLWSVDIDLLQFRKTYPHQTSSTYLEIPKSGILDYQFTISPAGEVTNFALVEGPAGGRIDPATGKLSWQAPLNMRPGTNAVFSVDAKLENGPSVAVELTAFKPYPPSK